MNIDPLIKVDDKTLQEMLKVRWCDLEAPLIAIPVDFKVKQKENGFFLFTRGSLYLFTKKVFAAPEFYRKLHLLDVTIFSIHSDSIDLTFDEFTEFVIRTPYAQQASEIMIRAFNEVTYGIPTYQNHCISPQQNINNNIVYDSINSDSKKKSNNLNNNNNNNNANNGNNNSVSNNKYNIKFMKIQNIENLDLNIPLLTERPKNALKWRALFLAHYVNLKGDFLFTVNYFEKFEQESASLKGCIVIGPSLHPGVFATAYGHAIGWEYSVDTVLFNRFSASRFDKFVDAILMNSFSIDRLVFTDYNSRHPVNFDFRQVGRTNVKEWYFSRNESQIISAFAEKLKYLPAGTTDIVFYDTEFKETEEFVHFFDGISSSPTTKTLKKLILNKIEVRPTFPFRSLQNFLQVCHRLETISISRNDSDAMAVLRALCARATGLRVIFLTQMQFRSSIDNNNDDTNNSGENNIKNCVLPPKLLHINVSGCWFTPASFRSLLWFLTRTRAETPFVAEMSGISVSGNVFGALAKLPFERCHANMCEFAYNSNYVPGDSMRLLFAFLFTQKRLRMLSMSKLECGDPTQFLKHLMQLIISLKLAGIDLRGNFEKPIFIQFIQALSQAPFLRRIGLPFPNIGDEGLYALMEVIQSLPQLTEVWADGFRPRTPEVFLAFWAAVVNHPEITACNFPLNDARSLRICTNGKGRNAEVNKLFDMVRDKRRVTNASQRVEYIKKVINDHNTTKSFEAGLASSQMTWDLEEDESDETFQ